jgi:4-amino-4-deoxy-L-arabinose transferase-like glycosyltransferase
MTAGEPPVAVERPAAEQAQPGRPRARRRLLPRPSEPHPAHGALLLVLIVSALLEGHGISHNGYGNNFYAAAVQSMLRSFHNFFFVSADPGGLMSVDKPPLALWLQAVSAKVLGFHALVILLPEAACGFLAVLCTYYVVAPRFGRWTAVGAAGVVAVCPGFVATTRDNNPDALLILLMLLAGWALVRAIETDRLRTLILAAVLAGLAFNTKALAGYLVVPGMGLAYLVCANGSWRRRAVRTAGGALVLGVVSLVWIVAVDLIPQSQRPWVGGTTDDSEISLTFAYNGFGRVEGQVGGSGTSFASGVVGASQANPAPNSNAIAAERLKALEVDGIGWKPLPAGFSLGSTGTTGATGATGASGQTGSTGPYVFTDTGVLAGTTGVTTFPWDRFVPQTSPTTTTTPAAPVSLRSYSPVALGPSPGPLRLFGSAFGTQAAWLLPFALVGLIALMLVLFRGGSRRDRRLALFIVFGGWLLAEFVVLSTSNGIVHPYYTSALAPGIGIIAACGAWACVKLVQRDRRYLLLPAAAVALTVAEQISLLAGQHNYLRWLWPLLILAAVCGVVLLLLRPRLAAITIAVMLGAALVAPFFYAKTVWEVPVDGTFPAAGPYTVAGQGGIGAPRPTYPILARLFQYADARAPHAKWAVLTQAAITAAPMILLGHRAAAIGGYGTQTPGVTPKQLGHLVAKGQARFVMLGGAYAWRGGNAASQAVRQACAIVDPKLWRSATNIGTPQHPVWFYPLGGLNYVLYDCKGYAGRLESA